MPQTQARTMSLQTPIAHEYEALTSFIVQVTESRSVRILLIMCSTRQDFIRHLLDDARTEDAEQNLLEDVSIRFLSAVDQVHMVFVPTLLHLRAHLASLSSKVKATGPGETPIELFIANAVGLHQNTSDYSAQGLSRTFALAVDKAHEAKMHLHLVEVVRQGSRQGGSGAPRQSSPWLQQVPLLSGNLGLGDDARTWIGRMVSIKQVLQRWFRFPPSPVHHVLDGLT